MEVPERDVSMAVKKQKEFTDKQRGLLAEIEDGSSKTGHYMVSESADLLALEMKGKGPIELNYEMREGTKIAARPRKVKPNGAESVNTTTDTFVNTAQPEAKSGGLPFVRDGIGLNLPQFFPVQEKTIRKPEYYPFSQLENVGDSFLVAATEKYPEPWKTLRSAVNAANKRYSKPTGETKQTKTGKKKNVLSFDKKFEVRRVTEGDKYANGFEEKQTGARIFRSI
jgi:hypothetical protein